jgi:hypothetical protein
MRTTLKGSIAAQGSGKIGSPVLAFISLFGLMTGASAAHTANSESKAFKPAFGLSLQSGVSSSLLSPESSDYWASLDFTAVPSVRLHPDWSVNAVLAASKGLTDLQEWTLNRTDIGLNWAGRSLNPYLRLSSGAGLILPFAGERLVRESFLVGARLGTRLAFQSPEFKRLTVSYEPGVAKFFHEYRTAVDGRLNPEFSVSQRMAADFQFHERVGASLGLVFQNGWTYGGSQSDRFRSDLDINFGITEKASFSFGVSTSGTQLKANGVDPNLAIFDPERGLAWTSFGYQF